MDLQLDAAIGKNYKIQSQAARRVTEAWATANLFCVACPSGQVLAERPNTPVRDYTCQKCRATYQLKSQNGAFGRAVHNSAYDPKMTAIEEGRAPHCVFLRYSRATWRVIDLFVVPGHFISPAIIQRRNPLRQGARREGWVGSNILLGALPLDARVVIVSGGTARDSDRVRGDWTRYAFLGADRRSRGGWGAATLACVHLLKEETGAREFTLRTFYARFSEELSQWHPDNKYVEAKISQQLQVLRDGGVLQFLGRGRYSVNT